ncbi:hypothetical protein PPYR_06610 [Photinus pyralis]|uniref:Peptidase M14 domain-containing protein n=1 Tax=Photinus pyralis TaxID=7054 RepID=A0A1Y1MPB3_PHOPY|nr:carboxypeptidase D-like isoform X2 [Photinus pyralis]KAB0798730.1 hypothetical protein PPYR_06610 [Photinus pyralis]
MRIYLCAFITVFTLNGLFTLDFSYHKYEELTNILKKFSQSYPKLSPSLKSIGNSKEGRRLWVLELTAVNRSAVGVPNVKLIGNIHGNEAVGRELLLHLIEYLGENYESDPTVTWIMKNTRIYILPSMNPDGFEKASEGMCVGEHGRCNVRNMDLNRNFPDFYVENMYPTQPESDAIQRWMDKIPFILSASLHGGALVANYPFDTVKELTSLPTNPPSISADDDVFVDLAKVYANRHPKMHLGLACPDGGKNFTGGITNGAAWYPFQGGMQDFNYFKHGCMELTLEISCCKYPSAKELPHLWEDNREALIEYITQAHRGVRGTIYDSRNQKPIAKARLKVIGREMTFNSSKLGEFWRILLPGKYRLEITATGYHSNIVPFEVIDHKNALPQPTVLSIPLYHSSLPKPTPPPTKPTTLFPPHFFTSTHPLLPAQDIKNYSKDIRSQNIYDDPVTLPRRNSINSVSMTIANAWVIYTLVILMVMS